MADKEYCERNALLAEYDRRHKGPPGRVRAMIETFPAADVVPEEDVLKFYYVPSIDEYWLGQRSGNFYFAEYINGQWVWTHSRYLPWGEHIVAPDTIWKEHTYPAKPEEISFEEWLKGFARKNITESVFKKRASWMRIDYAVGHDYKCSNCKAINDRATAFCPICGAEMMGAKELATIGRGRCHGLDGI